MRKIMWWNEAWITSLKGLTCKDTQLVNPRHTQVLKWVPIWAAYLSIIWVSPSGGIHLTWSTWGIKWKLVLQVPRGLVKGDRWFSTPAWGPVPHWGRPACRLHSISAGYRESCTASSDEIPCVWPLTPGGTNPTVQTLAHKDPSHGDFGSSGLQMLLGMVPGKMQDGELRSACLWETSGQTAVDQSV